MSAAHQNVSSEISLPQKHSGDFVKRIWKTFWILLIITIIELGLGLLLHALDLPDNTKRLLLKGIIIILSLAKAYFIVSVFMHLGDEIHNLILTIVIPLMLIIWAIVSFMIDGDSYKHMRNKYDKHFLERTMEVPPKTTKPAQ
ncbi:MAG: cytochrome C oxidase subunit IV family protein [Bacteroidetes bacterium]|nr:cytochrome C oxidase subunit IV family protein [Bacteroidota bacterium]